MILNEESSNEVEKVRESEEAKEAEEAEEVRAEGCKLMFSKGKDVRYVFTALSYFLHEANIVFSSEGLRIRSVDPSKVSLITLDIYGSGLEELYVPSEMKIGITFDILKKIVKRIGARNKVELSVDPARSRLYLTIYTKKGREAGLYRRFGIPTIAVPEEEIPEPSLSLPVRIKMSSDVFAETIADADEVSDSVTLTAKPESFIIRAVGEGGRCFEAEYSREDESIVEFEVSEEASSTYSTEFILDFSRIMRQISEHVVIRFASGKPLELTYEFSVGRASMLLAPRVA